MTHTLHNGDCVELLPWVDGVKCIFADPPDNIGLNYNEYKDTQTDEDYHILLWSWVNAFVCTADIVWISFNARWTMSMGAIVKDLLNGRKDLECKPCIQTFTFGQHSHHDLGNNHRPLWRIMKKDTKLYPDAIRVPSWRQEHGDKRADPRGRVPGDVFDFTRVTGNSKQRRPWHPTQLNEGLVERCIKLSTVEGDTVCDPFAGTGTTLRVCKPLNRPCTLIEMDLGYCQKIAEEHGMTKELAGWSLAC